MTRLECPKGCGKMIPENYEHNCEAEEVEE